MHYVEVVSLRRGSAKGITLTYHSPEAITVGSIVRVPFGKVSALAVVVDTTTKPNFNTKTVTEVIQPSAVPQALITTLFWIADYYATPLSNVFALALPRGIDKKRSGHRQKAATVQRPQGDITLTKEQQTAIANISSKPDATHLLQGVTGSGKTQIYIELARQTQTAGRSSLVLVPEISLTTQIVGDFQNQFEDVVVTHSGMSESQRHSIWQALVSGRQPQIIIGPRSALFVPVQNVGLIVIDECHETAYKQDTTPRYDARRVARILASAHQAQLVLGSATPSIVDRYLAEQRGQVHVLSKTIAKAERPKAMVVDARDRSNFTISPIISNQLAEALKTSVTNGAQSLIFHNRRGTATVGMCSNCGWAALCPDCEVPLTLHKDTHQLKCHICGFVQAPPNACPECQNADILFKGFGTKRVVEEVDRLLPGARVVRFDADNTKEQTLTHLYQAVHDGDYDVVVGTQIVAKGLDLPKLNTVGVVSAESSLHLPDFAAAERTFQLLTQVSGRAGRRLTAASQETAQVIIQSHRPDSPLLEMVLANDYESFYQSELKHRQQLHYPPFVYLLQLTCSYASRPAAQDAAEKMADELSGTPGVVVLGPTPSFYEKRAGRYRWTLVLKSRQRERLVTIARAHASRYWVAELDPVTLLT